MSHHSKNLPDNLGQSLRQLHQSHQDSQSLSGHGPSLLYPDDMVQRIKQKLTPPEWTLTTENFLTGTLAGEPVQVKLLINFDLDTDSLVRQHHILSHTLEQGYSELSQLASTANLEPPVAQILLNSLKPRSYGLTTKIKLADYQLDSLTKPTIKSPQLVEMVLDQDLVKFDYSRILTHLLNPRLLIPASDFAAAFTIPIEKLSGKEPFFTTFSLNIDQVNLVVKTGFSRINYD